jgi:hypothetical protein
MSQQLPRFDGGELHPAQFDAGLQKALEEPDLDEVCERKG